jgi:TPR repeat protein
MPLAWILFVRGNEALGRHHFDEAERLFKASASMGEPHAMDSLGTLLCRLGRLQEGIKWYRHAVEAGLPQAAWNLAMHYVPLGQNRRYRYWIQKAAAMGEEDAALEAAKIAKDPEYMTKLPLRD